MKESQSYLQEVLNKECFKLPEAGTELGDMWKTAGCMTPLDLIE